MATAADLLARLCSDAGPPPRTLVVAAHPDDEVIGMAGRLRRLGPAATILHVTDGSPIDGRDARDHGLTPAGYAAARRAELVAAVGLAGVGPGQLRELGCPDQQASFRMWTLVRQVAAVMVKFGPEVVLTHPYEGGHPDHDATAFAVSKASARLGRREPARLEFASYHMGPGGLTPFAFLPSDEPVTTLTLSPTERDLKRRMYDCYPTQADTLQYFPIGVECFRVAPRYDFARPPHGGTLFYEQFNWGVTGERWRELAAETAATLGPGR